MNFGQQQATIGSDLERERFPHWGIGIGWRPELAWFIENSPDVRFVEVIAESIALGQEIPASLERLREKNLPIIPHGISLSLGGAEPLDGVRLRNLATAADRLQSPLVSEHIAFVRAEGREAGHLLPIPRTRAALNVVVENIRLAQKELPVPLAVENIAALFQWPDNEYEEADFLTEILDQTDAWLLLDLANVHSNARNYGIDPEQFLQRLPLERIAYVHVAGGFERDGIYHDSHAHPISPCVVDLLRTLCERHVPAGVLLERDDHFPQPEELRRELESLSKVCVEMSSRPRSHSDRCSDVV